MHRIDVEHFFKIKLPLIEPANERRGGWSDVSLLEVGRYKYFVKRQSHHTYREPRRFYRATPTLRREYRNTFRLRKLGLKTPDIILYGEDDLKAVFVTRALENYVDMVTYLAETTDKRARTRFFNALTKCLLRIHGAGFHHGCLYGRHILVRPSEPDDIAFLDLEILRRTLRRPQNASKDIGQLFRHTKGIEDAEKALIIGPYTRRYPGFESLLAKQLKKRRGA